MLLIRYNTTSILHTVCFCTPRSDFLDIYFSMLYAVLSDKYPLINLSINEEPLLLGFPKMYNGKLENGCIYVVGDVSTFVVPERAGDYVLLFHETKFLCYKL